MTATSLKGILVHRKSHSLTDKDARPIKSSGGRRMESEKGKDVWHVLVDVDPASLLLFLESIRH